MHQCTNTAPAITTRSEKLAALFVALMLTVPFLLPYNQPPIRSFYQEWIAAALGCAAFGMLLLPKPGSRLEVPFQILLPSALIGLIVIHALTSRLVFPEQGVLGAMYIGWACMMSWVGYELNRRIGRAGLAALLAGALAFGASVSALLGMFQYFGWDHPAWLLPASHARIQGNLGQPNHLANYLCLGIASAVYLAATRRLRSLVAGGLVLLLVAAVSFSGSRAVVLYLVFMLVGAALLRWRHPSPAFTAAVWWIAAATVLFLILQVLAIVLSTGTTVAVEPIADRLLRESSGIDTRLRNWHAALLMASVHPWFGSGFQGYAWHYFQLAPGLSPQTEPFASNNAHNLLFQIVAEFGAGGLLLLLSVAAYWLIVQFRTGASTAGAWLWAAVGILLLHSGLEYPLWYAYFLGLFSLLIGAGWDGTWLRAGGRAARMALYGCAAISAVALATLWSDYRDLSGLPRANHAPFGHEPQSQILSIYQRSLFPHVLVFALAAGAAVDAENIDAKIALNSTALRVLPAPEIAYRQALFLALAGKQQAAEKAWDQAVAAYPQHAAGMIRAIEADELERFTVLIEYARRKTGKTL